MKKLLLVVLVSTTLFTSCGKDHHHRGKGKTSNPQNPNGLGPAPVSLSTTGSQFPASGDLQSAGTYVILAKAGISDAGGSSITGAMGVSPAPESYITGFALVRDASNQFSTAVNVTGRIYSADLSVPTPANLTSSISNMETAYTDAAGRSNPDHTELGAGDIGGLTLTPGLYKWGTSLNIPTALTLTGGANDVYIMQIAGDITLANGIAITLSGGLQAKNIYWQVAGQITVGTTAHFEGILLCQTAIVMNNGSSLNGRAYAQTAVTLNGSVVIQP